jgi:hypothetical protein
VGPEVAAVAVRLGLALKHVRSRHPLGAKRDRWVVQQQPDSVDPLPPVEAGPVDEEDGSSSHSKPRRTLRIEANVKVVAVRLGA